MKHYKYRVRYKYGHSEWKFISFPDKTPRIEEELIYKGLLPNWSVDYLGVDIRKVSAPPK